MGGDLIKYNSSKYGMDQGKKGWRDLEEYF